MISQSSKKDWRNPWFLGVLCVVIAAVTVNGILVWFSMHQRSTLVDHEYSTKDRKSDTETINDIESQNALAWKTSIKMPKVVVLGSPSDVEIGVVDRDGKPVSGEMNVVAYRPSDANKDFVVPFKEVSSGNYQGFISFPIKGYWELRIRVKRGKDDFETESNKLMVAEK
jgi:hypothetical protein